MKNFPCLFNIPSSPRVSVKTSPFNFLPLFPDIDCGDIENQYFVRKHNMSWDP